MLMLDIEHFIAVNNARSGHDSAHSMFIIIGDHLLWDIFYTKGMYSVSKQITCVAIYKALLEVFLRKHK